MSTVLEELVVKLSADLSELRTELDKTKKLSDGFADKVKGGFEKVRGSIGTLGSSLFSLKGALAGVGIGAMAKSFIDAASTTEGLRTRLNILLGSATEGAKVFDSMAAYASKVPFEYEEIMNAATTLSGVLKGGAKDINAWMPLIGDLAAASGLSVEQTTDQVVKMMNAGASSADMFKQRGILAMMGFKDGVTYSAAETQKILIESWAGNTSKFRGATDQLAKTWEGSMSMLSDKWFAFRNVVMEAGLFDYLKAAVSVFDTDLGDAVNGSKKDAAGWAGTIIDGIKVVMKTVGFLQTAFQGFSVIWTGLKISFQGLKLLIVSEIGGIMKTVNLLIEGFNSVFDTAAQPLDMTTIDTWASEAKTSISELGDELQNKLLQPTGLQTMDERLAKIDEKFKQIRESASKAGSATGSVKPPPMVTPEVTAVDTKGADEYKARLAERVTSLRQSLMTETEATRAAYDEQNELIKEAYRERNISGDEFRDLLTRNDKDFQDKLTKIDVEAEKQRAEQAAAILRERLSAFSSMFGDLSSLMQSENRKQFEIGKKAAIAQAIIDTIASAQSAYKAMASIPYVGPALGVAAAAAAIAAGNMRVQKIRATHFGGGSVGGGGGGGGVSGGGGGGITPTVPPGTPTSQTGTGGRSTAPQITVNIQGNMIGNREFISDLVTQINDVVQGRDVVLVSAEVR